MNGDIFIDESEAFEDVSTKRSKFSFPAIYFFKRSATLTAYLNKAAVQMLGDAQRVSVKASNHFIVFSPSGNVRHNKIARVRNHSATLSIASLDGIVTESTAYRCYPYKGGIAIKRYEPIQGGFND